MSDKQKEQFDDLKEVIEEETRSSFGQKNDINKYMMKNPTFQANAKSLGIAPDDVIYSYTFDELNDPDTYSLIAKNLTNKEVKKIVIHSEVTVEGISRITKEATKYKIPFTIVNSPEYRGDIALVLIRSFL